MSKVRVAINGFGRIGRLVLRAALMSGRDDIEFVAVNDLAPAEQNAYLLQYDSVHGKLPMDVKLDGEYIVVGNQKIKCIAEKDPTKLPWRDLDIDVVMECTGIFTAAEKARVHLDQGAKRVLVSAPSAGADKTIVFGVNQDTLTSDDLIVSNASCTTNCLAPVAQVLDDTFGIVSGWMTTVHAYTGDQQLLDKNHKDFRRARAAGLSMIPTSTGAAKAIGLVLPKLAGKLDGMAIRVPTPDVSVVELVVNLERDATVEAVNNAMRAAESKTFGYNELPMVSVDFKGDMHSSIFDASQTKVLGDRLVHVTAWYDNEWGFSNRMGDTAVAMGKLIK
ncbi:MAG: type I glyceraldehyde-3-phosphate dehydrogenase [Proteobacteria bacterium]|uniref:Glyceraldehyde-3-phosphate dehydrogenase n=1 Tax=Candidatus Enterousia excrementavium TaxID=2840789 RepID=A0A940ICC0_9PROT|nr:type I glyceraldehyde-3-phosphate dehydrogenase [Candidatus Enterousia excrementavium]